MKRLIAVLVALAMMPFAVAQEAPKEKAPEDKPEAPKVKTETLKEKLAREAKAEEVDELKEAKYTPPEKLEDWSKLDEVEKLKKLKALLHKYEDLFDREYYLRSELIRVHEIVPRIRREFELIKKFASSKQAEPQKVAYGLLPLSGVEVVPKAIDFLVDKLDAADQLSPAEAMMAARAIGKLPRVTATGASLRKTKDKAQLELIAKQKKTAETQYLAIYKDAMDRLKAQADRQRELAVVALGELGHPEALDALKDRLDAETPAATLTERLYIYDAMARIGSPTIIDYLVAIKAGRENLLEQIAITDTIYRLQTKPDLRLIAGNMGAAEKMLETYRVDEETVRGQEIVLKSLDDLIDDIKRAMARKPEPKGKKGKGQKKPTMKKAGSKSKAGQQQGGKAAKAMRPGMYDASGMNEGGDKELEKIEKYLHDRVDDWGNLPPDKKQEIIETLKNGNVPPHLRKVIDKYFEKIAEGN